MHTKWNMTFFLFMGFIGAGLLLYSALNLLSDKNHLHRSISALAASASAISSVLIVTMGLNDPSKLINILGRPFAGFSSAVVMQIIIALAGLLLFFKSIGKKPVKLAWVSVGVFVVSVFCLSRVYMISTRPALNSIILFILFLLLSLQTTGLFMVTKNRIFADNIKKTSFILISVSCFYGLGLLLFAIRTIGLNPEDRVLQPGKLLLGELAPIFWGIVILTFIIPLAFYLYSFLSRKIKMAPLVRLVNLVGVFMLSILINQMPTISRGIDGRFLS